MNRKSNSLFIYVSQIVSFSKCLCQNMLYKAENWHALSNEHSFQISVNVPLLVTAEACDQKLSNTLKEEKVTGRECRGY